MIMTHACTCRSLSKLSPLAWTPHEQRHQVVRVRVRVIIRVRTRVVVGFRIRVRIRTRDQG